MRVAFATSDETVRLIATEGLQAVSRAAAADHIVVLTEIDPSEPGALEGRAAVLLEIPADLLAGFGKSGTNENRDRTFEVPMSFLKRFPVIATRAAAPPSRTWPRPRSPSSRGVIILAGLPVILFGVAIYLAVGDDAEDPDGAPPARTTPARSTPRSAPERPAAVKRERRRQRAARSRAVGSPTDGGLVGGVPLPSEGRHFFTWNIPRARSPNPRFRRYGTYAVVQRVLRVVSDYRRAHPGAPRVGLGDLSLPRGGEFGVRYGGTGHVAHRNGTEVDVLYPRRDRKEQAPVNPGQIDLRLAQDLLDRFIDAGAVQVKVDGRLGLRAPAGKMEPAPFHEEHMHVRFPAR